MFYNLVVLVIIGSAWLLYRKFSKTFTRFKERGVPYVKPMIICGNNFSVIRGKETICEVLQRLYTKFYNEKVFGFYNFGITAFVMKDAELVRNVTIKHFDHFVNHNQTFDEDCDRIVGRSIFSLHDENWRVMRSSLSPIFTSSKMKMMFGMVSECAQDFIKHFETKAGGGKLIIDASDTFARFTIDGISTAVLGFKGDCIENEKSLLFKMATTMSGSSFVTGLKMFLIFVAKPIYILLGLQFTCSEARHFLQTSIIDVMQERQTKNISRPDIIQLMIQIKNGKLTRDKEDDNNLKNFSANIEYDVGDKTRKKIEWTNEDFMAQGFIFFGAGFDTTKTLLQMTSYELAKNREVQQELIEEVDEVLMTLNGKPISYEALHQMKFLDQVISEALRFWPPAFATDRMCNKDYSVDLGNGKTILIKAGEFVILPISAIHRDEKYYENPNTFDPHRFDDDRKDSIVPGSFIPFGYGPRVCIGSRFALMEAKLLIFNILSKFSIEVCDKTPKNIEFASAFGVFEFKEKIFLEFRQRKLERKVF